jgi:hypothetical protein
MRFSAGTSAAPKRWRPHSLIGCSGVVLQELRAAPFDPGMRHVHQLRVKLVDQARLAKARLSEYQHELTVAMPRSLPTSHQDGHFFGAANEGSKLALPSTAATATGANKPGSGTPLSTCAPRSSATNSPAT